MNFLSVPALPREKPGTVPLVIKNSNADLSYYPDLTREGTGPMSLCSFRCLL